MKPNKSLYRHLINLLVLFSTLTCLSQKYAIIQTYDVDSLLEVLPGQLAEERINSLNRLAVSLYFEDIDEGKNYLEEALALANEQGFEKGVADALRNYGHIHQYEGNHAKALRSYYEALEIYENLNDNYSAGWICYDIAKTHYWVDNCEKTIEYGQKALEKFRIHKENSTTVGSVRDTMSVIIGLADTYMVMGMMDKSLELILTYLEVGGENSYEPAEMVIFTILAGERFYHIGEKERADAFLKKALAYPDTDPNVEALKYRAVASLGRQYEFEGIIDSAILYYRRALEWYDERGFLILTLDMSMSLGNIYLHNNELSIAEKFYRKSEKVFQEIQSKGSWYRDDSLKYIATIGFELFYPIPRVFIKERIWQAGEDTYYYLYRINDKKNRIREALRYYILYSEAKDTLNALRRNIEVIEVQTKYEDEQKEKQIVYLHERFEFADFKLKQSRYFLLGLAILILLVIALSGVLIRQNKLREHQKNLLLHQKLFRLQMNPHFIFNSLASIQGFITEKDPRTASRYLSRFARLVRNIMESSVDEFITLAEEISTIENYLELQKVRYEGKFDYAIEVDGAIDREMMTIPSMLAQPFIENAIEHGIRHKDATGTIRIRIKQKRNIILLEIEDDGVGRKKAAEILSEQDPGHQSMATAITLERISALNKKLKTKITLEIVDLKDNTGDPAGTGVILRIPVTK